MDQLEGQLNMFDINYIKCIGDGIMYKVKVIGKGKDRGKLLDVFIAVNYKYIEGGVEIQPRGMNTSFPYMYDKYRIEIMEVKKAN